jgi:hypothetical protein
VETISNKDIVGPWDLAVSFSKTKASLFISNALGGNTSTDLGAPFEGICTVVRLDFALSPASPPHLTGSTVIGKDYPWQANSAALVLAPTGTVGSCSSTTGPTPSTSYAPEPTYTVL